MCLNYWIILRPSARLICMHLHHDQVDLQASAQIAVVVSWGFARVCLDMHGREWQARECAVAAESFPICDNSSYRSLPALPWDACPATAYATCR